jgi:hypothetical protein
LEQKLEDKVIDEVFEMWWPKLESKISKILEEQKVENKALREDRELLDEILAIVRFTAKNSTSPTKSKLGKANYDVEKFESLVSSFIASMEFIFDWDWEHTKSCLTEDSIDYFISPTGNFLNPNIKDEGNNWANRVGFLSSYRSLREFMNENKLQIIEHFSDNSDLPF